MTGVSQPERRIVMAADMERYSRRGNLLQFEAQQAFQDILRRAAEAAGFDRAVWTKQPAGDGEVAILPADAREPVVLGRLVPEIDRLLREYNRSRLPVAKVRLRIAIGQGLVHLDGANGYPGNAVIETCRLLDVGPLKRALKAFEGAGVALIVPDGIYQEVVNEYYEGLRPERFVRVEVALPEKEFRAVAWICVVDEDVRTAGDLGDGPQSAGDPGRPDGGPGPRGGDAGPSAPSGGAGSAAPSAGDIAVGVNVVGPNSQSVIGNGGIAIGSMGDHGRVTGGGGR